MKKALNDEVVEVWLHSDHDTLGEKHRALQQRLAGLLSNPYWIVLDPQTERVLRRQEFTMDADQFLRFLRGD